MTSLSDTWDFAIEYHNIKRRLPNGPKKDQILSISTEIIIQKAKSCLHHLSPPSRVVSDLWINNNHADPDPDVSIEEGFFAEPLNPEKLWVSFREEKKTDVVLVLDMSLSMTGEKLALLTVVATVLALKLNIKHLGVVVFDSNAYIIKRLGEVMPIRALVKKLLEVPARGYTNIHAGLKQGLDVLQLSSEKHRVGVILTDGLYNMGWDPVLLAAKYPQLHVVQFGNIKDKKALTLCQKLAKEGRGFWKKAENEALLPEIANKLMQEILRSKR